MPWTQLIVTQILSLQNGIRTVTELGFILGNTEISFCFLNYGCDGFLYMSISVPAEFSDGCLQTGRAILRESESNYHIPRPMPAFRIYNISTQRGHMVVWNSKVWVNKRKSQCRPHCGRPGLAGWDLEKSFRSSPCLQAGSQLNLSNETDENLFSFKDLHRRTLLWIPGIPQRHSHNVFSS